MGFLLGRVSLERDTISPSLGEVGTSTASPPSSHTASVQVINQGIPLLCAKNLLKSCTRWQDRKRSRANEGRCARGDQTRGRLDQGGCRCCAGIIISLFYSLP